MTKVITVTAVVATVVLASCMPGQSAPAWKVFRNRSGWSIRYPTDWHITSCQRCKDATAPNVFVDFISSERQRAAGWVMVEHLVDKPPLSTPEEWLRTVSNESNLNPHIQEQKLVLNGLPALKVRYRTSDGQEMEEVFVVSGSKTFSVTFTFDHGVAESRTPIENLPNYGTYLKMLASFRAQRR